MNAACACALLLHLCAAVCLPLCVSLWLAPPHCPRNLGGCRPHAGQACRRGRAPLRPVPVPACGRPLCTPAMLPPLCRPWAPCGGQGCVVPHLVTVVSAPEAAGSAMVGGALDLAAALLQRASAAQARPAAGTLAGNQRMRVGWRLGVGSSQPARVFVDMASWKWPAGEPRESTGRVPPRIALRGAERRRAAAAHKGARACGGLPASGLGSAPTWSASASSAPGQCGPKRQARTALARASTCAHTLPDIRALKVTRTTVRESLEAQAAVLGGAMTPGALALLRASDDAAVLQGASEYFRCA